MQYLTRQAAIADYVTYDAGKKNRLIPANLADWPWSDPNALDSELLRHGFKSGIISGFKTWRVVQLSRHELLQCAVVDHLFRDFPSPPEGFPRALSELIHYPQFLQWRPKEPTDWYERLERGQSSPNDWPLILRPAVKSEAPAKWYIEDGSGRAVCVLRRLCRHPHEDTVAMAYLGVEPDCASNFMQQYFRELLE